MKNTVRSTPYIFPVVIILLGILLLTRCESPDNNIIPKSDKEKTGFPPYITPVNEYFVVQLFEFPAISESSYTLKITGLNGLSAELSLEELKGLKMYEKTLTIECIGNPANGREFGNISWKGFNVYDLLDSLGVLNKAVSVLYHCADGYFTVNTIDELKNGGVIGALFMNGGQLPPLYGFPLRIIFPGYYGARNPGWVTEIEVLDHEVEDFYEQDGWKTGTPTSVDSKIFFPEDNSTIYVGEELTVGGAAFGAKRIKKVEVSVDGGDSWIQASIIEDGGHDYEWVFWKAEITPVEPGNLILRARATDTDGYTQPPADLIYLDGTISQPKVSLNVVERESK